MYFITTHFKQSKTKNIQNLTFPYWDFYPKRMREKAM